MGFVGLTNAADVARENGGPLSLIPSRPPDLVTPAFDDLTVFKAYSRIQRLKKLPMNEHCPDAQHAHLWSCNSSILVTEIGSEEEDSMRWIWRQHPSISGS